MIAKQGQRGKEGWRNRKQHKGGSRRPFSGQLLEQLESRLLMSGSGLGVVVGGQPQVQTPAVQVGDAVSPQLTITPAGFSISAGLVQTMGNSFQFGSFLPVAPTTESGGALVYVYPGWTVTLTPTADASAIHFVINIVNTGSVASTVPDFTVCTLSGGLVGMWENNQAGPFVLDQTLADGTHCALTIDDSTYPIVAEFIQATNPWNGTENISFHPTGGQYTRYNLGLVPVTVAPGGSTTIPFSLRFGTDSASVTTATQATYEQAYPYALAWTDKRLMLRGDMFQYVPTPANPQGFQGGFDINDPANGQKFDDWVMAYAARSIATCQAANAGTWIEWDLEGKEQGWDYKGNPELIDVLNSGWAHKDASGVELIDRFFKAFQDAGIHVGVCVRPWTLRVDANGTIYADNTVSGVDSVANHIDYCYQRWGVDAFYLDSPQFEDTAAYRSMMLARPQVLLIPEYAPESWMQFCAQMVWPGDNMLNWGSVPRTMYGDQGWGVYFHQSMTTPNVFNDVQLGSAIMEDWGWMGSANPELQQAADLYAATQQTGLSIAVPAASSAESITGSSVNLSVLGGEIGGENDLTYSWSASGPAPVMYSDNGSTTAENTVATFCASGVYNFEVTVTDANGASVTSDVSVNVNSAPTNTAIRTSGTVSTSGQAVKFTTNVKKVGKHAGAPTGIVTYMDGSTVLGTAKINASGQASFVTSLLPVGWNSITAVYSGDGTYLASISAIVNRNVNQVQTKTKVVASSASAIFGDAVTFTAKVQLGSGKGTPMGSVTFMDGTTVLGIVDLSNGVAKFVTSVLSTGKHNIVAVYLGDQDAHGSASGKVTHNVAVDTSLVS